MRSWSGSDWVDRTHSEERGVVMLEVEGLVNSIFDSMTWLLSETENNRVWLVDCGDIDKILEKVRGRVVTGVLLTHAHFDHIYGLPELLLSFPECMVYTNESGRETLANSKLNMSFYHEQPLTVISDQVKICCEGDEITLFKNQKAKVYETPGHHPSCIAYLADGLLFTGDAYIPGIKVVTNLPGGDKNLAKESLDKLFNLSVGKIICSGHCIS